MTLLMFDGFETWGWSTAQAAARGITFVTGGTPAIAAGGRYGVGRVLTGGSSSIGKALLGTPTTLYIGCAVIIPSSVAAQPIIQPRNGTSSLGDLQMDISRNLWIRNRSGTNQGVSIGVMPLAQWQYFEIKWVLGTTNSNGSIEVRQGGVVLASRTGIDTGGGTFAGAASVVFTCPGTASLDDLYAGDGAYLGEVRTLPLAPTGAGAHTMLTPTGAASNWDCVDEVPPDDDTTYVASSTVNDIDTYVLADLPGNVQSVVAVQTSLYGRKDDVSARSVADVIRIGGTDYVGSGGALGASYANLQTIYPTSPATGSAWGISEINGMEAGVKVTA